MMRYVPLAQLASRYDPSFGRVFFFSLLLGSVVFLRPPTTNFVFDEQEALLANPFLNGSSEAPFYEVLAVDFWGRTPERTIGSYRPLPNLMWRALAPTLGTHSPFFFLFLNLSFHALSAAALARVARELLVARADPVKGRPVVWGVAVSFVVVAMASEAVCSAVGLSDVLVGCSTIFGLWCLVSLARGFVKHDGRGILGFSLSLFLCMSLGCFSKESMVGSLLVLVGFAWPLARHFGLQAGSRVAFFGAVSLLSALSFTTFTAVRHHFFPAQAVQLDSLLGNGPLASWLAPALSILEFPVIPEDPNNNPLFQAPSRLRLPTALAASFELATKTLFPIHLTGDYSFPRRLPLDWGITPTLGALVLLGLTVAVILAEARFSNLPRPVYFSAHLAFSAVIAYLPVSNAVILLPTILAERLFYTPSLLMIVALGALLPVIARSHTANYARWTAVFLAFQAFQARAHAFHYSDDVSFWRATAYGDPPSAKSVLNLGIMLGARGDLQERVRLSRRAVELSPRWAMAHVYLADAHCRRGELARAKPHYLDGLRLSPNRKALAALALQCIWDHDAYPEYRSDIQRIAREHPGSWLDFLIFELELRGEEHGGIPPRYRPRRYNRAD